MIVCWYHLVKRCQQDLSRACRGREHRREVESAVLKSLWHGRVDAALEELIGYLEVRRPWGPRRTAGPARGEEHRHLPHPRGWCRTVIAGRAIRIDPSLPHSARARIFLPEMPHIRYPWLPGGSGRSGTKIGTTPIGTEDKTAVVDANQEIAWISETSER
jgi:hypothetical protein